MLLSARVVYLGMPVRPLAAADGPGCACCAACQAGVRRCGQIEPSAPGSDVLCGPPQALVQYRRASLLQLVPAVTELILAEMWYLQIDDDRKPINLYINSTGTTRADGETVSPCPRALLGCGPQRFCPAAGRLFQQLWLAAKAAPALAHPWLAEEGGIPSQVGFETEGTAIYDMMKHLSVPVSAWRPAQRAPVSGRPLLEGTSACPTCAAGHSQCQLPEGQRSSRPGWVRACGCPRAGVHRGHRRGGGPELHAAGCRAQGPPLHAGARHRCSAMHSIPGMCSWPRGKSADALCWPALPSSPS